MSDLANTVTGKRVGCGDSLGSVIERASKPMVGDRITGPKQEAVVEVTAVSDSVELVVAHHTGSPDIVILGIRSIAISDWPRVVRRALEMGAGFASA